MTDELKMGRTRQQAAKEGQRVLDIGKAAGLTEWNCPAFGELSNTVAHLAAGEWDAEFLGPIGSNIAEASYAAEAVLEASRQPVVRSISADGQCNECGVFGGHADKCGWWAEQAPAQTLAPVAANLPAELVNAGAAAVVTIEAKQAANTRRAYASALGQYDQWRDLRSLPLGDQTLALYIGALIEGGRSAALASMVVNAAKDRGDVVGDLAQDALAGFRRLDAARPRRQAKALSLEDVGAMMAVASRPRRRGRGMESTATAAKRARVDMALLGCLFYGAMRRSEVAALKVADVEPQDDGTCLVNVRASKTNPHGEAEDVRLVKNGCADALAALVNGRDASASVFGLTPHTINHRIRAAAAAAGIQGAVSAHSGRRGAATELVKRGASTTEVMLAGGWKSASMVTRYAAGAKAKGRAVAKYL